MVIGTKAKGTMVNEFPGLATLDEDDNLRHTTDFRSVYCSLLEQWLKVDATGIIPKASSFARPCRWCKSVEPGRLTNSGHREDYGMLSAGASCRSCCSRSSP